MKLFGANLSPFYERAVIVLDVKSHLDDVAMSMPSGGLGSAEHVAANPLAKIPYLVLDDGTVLTEGQVIAEFFDSHFDGADLTPNDPVAAARVHQITRLIDFEIMRGFAPALGAAIFNRRDEAAIKEGIEVHIPRAFDAVEHFIDGNGFLVGDGFTLADAAMIPVLFQLNVFLAQFGVPDFGDRPKLSTWRDNMNNSSICARSHARMQGFLDKLRGQN